MNPVSLNSLIDTLVSSRHLSEQTGRDLENLARGKPLSLFWELRTLMYLGVLFFIAGVALTIKTHFHEIGHWAIIGSLTAGCLGLGAYCFSKVSPYTNDEVPAGPMALDYLLYLACTLYALDIAYLETHFQFLGAHWQAYLLFSSALFFGLAYRFDNRLVLALALTTLASWCGLKVETLAGPGLGPYRGVALMYGAVVGISGFLLARRSIKPGFLDVYLNFAAHFVLAALVSGTSHTRFGILYVLALITACGVTAAYAVKRGRFLYMAYAVVYGYVGVSGRVLRNLDSGEAILLYFVVSSIAVVVGLAVLSRWFKDRR